MYRQGAQAPLATALLLAMLLAAPTARASRPTVSAWIPYWDQRAATEAVLGSSSLVSTASPFWFESRSARSIRLYPGARDGFVTSSLRAAGISVVPTVTTSMRPREALRVLGRERSRDRHIKALLRLTRPYAGLDLDYEHPALTRSRSLARRVRRALTVFFSDLCQALQKRSRRCLITVMPRTSDVMRLWRGSLIPWVYDYRALGTVADRVRVMAYDQHAAETRPGPIGGLPWVRRVAHYALSEAPAQKLELGIPLYGREWNGSEPASRSLTWRRAVELRDALADRAGWSRHTASGFFTYGGRPVWYSDRKASFARARVARESGLAGVSLWAPGAEDPGTWLWLSAALRGRRAPTLRSLAGVALLRAGSAASPRRSGASRPRG